MWLQSKTKISLVRVNPINEIWGLLNIWYFISYKYNQGERHWNKGQRYLKISFIGMIHNQLTQTFCTLYYIALSKSVIWDFLKDDYEI